MARELVAGSVVALVAAFAVVIGVQTPLPTAESERPGAAPAAVAPIIEAAASGGPLPGIAAIETAPFEEVAVAEPIEAPAPVVARAETPLARKAVYLSGTVLDTEGEPVAAATVHLRQVWRDGEGGRRWRQWSPAVKAGADGTFAFTKRSLDPQYDYALTGKSPHFYQRDLAWVAPGDDHVEVELVRGATMSGRVARWQGAPSASRYFDRALSVAVRGLSGGVDFYGRIDGPARPTTHLAVVKEDGTFEVHGLPPGSATVSVEILPGAPPLAVYEGVPVPEGRPVVDPRLLPIDLRGDVRWATITVRDPRGAPRPGVPVRMFVADGSRVALSGTTGDDGRWAFPVGDPVRVGVGSRETTWVSLQAVDGDRDVVLGPSVDLTVRFAGAQLPTKGPPWIHVSVQYLGPAADPERETGSFLGRQCVVADGPLHFPSPGAGRYRVDLVPNMGRWVLT